MSEFIKVPRDALENGNIRSSFGDLRGSEKVNSGEEAPKEFVELSIRKDSQERRVGRFLKRKYTNPERALSDALKADELRAAGIPVPPTVRYGEDDDGKPFLLITDLTENGQNTVWSMNNPDEDLPELNAQQLASIRSQLSTVTERAAKSDFLINADAYFIVGKPDGSIEIMIGDFGMGVVKSQREAEYNRQYNQESAERFLKLTEDITHLPKAA